MPLEVEKTQQNYIKVQKLFLSSADRNENSKGVYQYQIDLKTEIQYVIGFEVTGYNFPSEISPTFVAPGPGFNGTWAMDFTLQAGALEKTFTAYWPEKLYEYENVTVPYLSFVQVCQQLLAEVVKNDVDFGIGRPNQVTFAVIPDPNEVTVINVSGPGVTGFRFLWASGPNKNDAAFNAMGFNQVDTAFALTTIAPSRINLRPFRYLDINLKEAEEFSPLKRVYTTDNFFYGTIRNDPSVTRTRLLSSHPLQRLKKVNVTITLENGIVPPVLNGLDHEITLTVFSIANEEFVPNWVRQVFVL